MKHISLFSGIGGDTLAAEWAGFETVLFVENDKFCQKVLNKHWPDVPIIGDIKDVTKETMANAKVKRWKRSREARGGRARLTDDSYGLSTQCFVPIRHSNCGGCRCPCHEPITLITGGFPCQPVSVAGKQRGKEDDRWLWPEMLRVIEEVRPKWVVAENVAGLIRMGLDDCISGLENIGYTTEPYIIPACAVNAPHRRDRVFIVAHASQHGPHTPRVYNPNLQVTIKQDIGQGEIRGNEAVRAGMDNQQDVADTNNTQTTRQREYSGEIYGIAEPKGLDIRSGKGWWAVEPDVGRVAYGISSRVDRLKALGNAIVPQQIYPILKAIADLELKV